MPVMTFRMWTVGLLLCCLSAGLNTFFNFRYPAPCIVPLVLILIAYPFGKAAAFIFPCHVFRLPRYFGSHEFSFNPGPWNIKEHACVYLMGNVSVTVPYAINTIVVSEMNYKIKLGTGFNLVLILATQLTGFGLAGLARRFLVWPANMIWPQNLVACSLLNTLHAEQEFTEDRRITRYRFFMITVTAAFLYYFLPGFLFQALSMFSYICWIAPNNVVVNQLFGVHSGLGLGILTFDWSQISFIGSPLMVPWWAQIHVMVGFVLFYWVWDLARFPISSNMPFDNTGHPYDVARITWGPHKIFNLTAYENYSPLYLPTTYVITYFLSFAVATCIITHTILYHGRGILENIRHPQRQEEDIHAKLMRRYPEVPSSWYATCWAVFFSLAIVAVKAWDTDTPIWALVLAVVLSVIYILPAGFVYAMTSQAFCLNVVGEIIPGAILPGNPVAKWIFKAYSVQTLQEALSFVQDLKLGHYMKIPPRTTFLAQLVATIVASFVQVAVKEWLTGNVHTLCNANQKDLLTCPQNQVYFTASAIWGLIGPKRQFGAHSTYNPELYALVFGAFIPLPFWLLKRWNPNKSLPIFNMPVILNGALNIPPATGINYSSWFVVGFIFQYLMRKRHFAWWAKFNYILSAALDSGTVLSICAVFIFLQFPGGGVSLNWIGNDIFMRTADWNSTAWRPFEGK
ncbi:hypothetical protein M422DRAFT_61375 [Sphaerobolus stellatus SS14]|uniref:Oligopeptide transporter n=1 Tax=Sphaerobolus stellatus (strain SS14) TaxID=990650 RepID=A0A0C9TW93_SPHS4|nr:hypothetical protein M422DRAFT_61375 [Sphaerobolus stellatus SS14]